jgi:hypothetical protein
MCEHLRLANLMLRLRLQRGDVKLNMILAGCVYKDVDCMQDMDESELVLQELPNVKIF